MLMEIPVLYEDKDTLVINKPVGLVVNRAESIKGETVQDWADKRLKISGSQIGDKLFLQRSGICHRLDKETSGCLIIAKSPESLRYYLRLFKDRRIAKSYTALVHGRVEPDHGEVRLPLKRSLFDREKWQVHYEGKRAITEWQVINRFIFSGHEHWGDALTLLSINLKTGRTHQIRVHMSFLGWPIFADDKYLNKKFSGADRKYLSHHFLHAEMIQFSSFEGKKVVVKAPLPGDSEIFLSSLQGQALKISSNARMN